MRNGADGAEWVAQIYSHPEAIASLAHSTPIASHVKVDFELWGCPVSGPQMLAVVNALLLGVAPRDNADKVCTECKRHGYPCVMVSRGVPCMGPVTRAGCGALCPSLGRDCYGCYGPAENANTDALAAQFGQSGLDAAGHRAALPVDQQPGAGVSGGGRQGKDAIAMSEQKRTVAIHVPVLARVEGEGALDLRIDDGDIAELRLRIFEPPRFFEKFLEGRHYSEIPDMVARICGICPVAYQVTAAQALEKLFGVDIGPWARAMRRVFYCGEWIQSHSLHIHLLAAPDFFGCSNAIELAAHRAGRSAPRPAHPGAGQRTDGPVRRALGASGGGARRRLPWRARRWPASARCATSCAPRCRRPKR